MGTEREIGLKVEDFMGVNSQLSSEDLQDQFYKQSQNLWERKIGELERRGGAEIISAVDYPGTTSALGKNLIFGNTGVLYDKVLGKTRLMQLHACYPAADLALGTVTAAFSTDVVNGKWGTAVGAYGAFVGCSKIAIWATGLGTHGEVYTTTTGMPAIGDTKKLTVTVSAAFGESITNLSVYARVRYNYTTEYQWMWVGNIDLVATPTGTFTFNYGPFTLPTADPGAPRSEGTSSATWSLAATTGGTLTPGKTYYVGVLRQKLVYSATATDCRCLYLAESLTSITLAPGETAISVTCSAVNSGSSILAIGLHPRTLIPVSIPSNSANWQTNILSMPTHSGCINCYEYSAGNYKYAFTHIHANYREMFAKIVNSRWIPVLLNNPIDMNYDHHYSNKDYFSGDSGMESISDEGTYEYTQAPNSTQDFLVWCAQDNIESAVVTTNLVISDGYTATRWSPRYGSASVPFVSYLTYYKERLVAGGGKYAGSGFNKIYFTEAYDIFDFGVPGAKTTAQYVGVESTGEPINGIGIYTNTTGTSGPNAQLLITKQNSSWVLSDLPTYTSGSNNNVVMVNLSNKVGCANHRTIVNTEVGTIMASANGVYLIRESGEPIPIGDEIANLIKSEDPSVGQDTSRWNAVYHDNHYKLAYSVSGSATISKELWLDIRKMKLMKGQPVWNGPHIGREIKYSVVEKSFNDSIQEKRIVIDGTNFRWAFADSINYTDDYGTAIACVFETKDAPLQDSNLNKLHTRTYWRLKVDDDLTFTELTTALNEDGEQTETKYCDVSPISGHTGGTLASFLSARQKIYQFFPTDRIRGETLRKKWSYSGAVRFAISGLTMFYKVENRRPS